MFPLPLDGVDEFCSRVERAWLHGRPSVRRDALVVGLGLLGLRWIECARLVCGDLLTERALIHVPSAKGGVPRIVPVGFSWLHSCLAVRRLFPGYGPPASLFVTRSGHGLDYPNVLRRCRAWTKAHFGRPYSFHCLRHTAAVRHYLATRDVLSVQRLLGHRSLKWTAEYLASLQIIPAAGLPPFVEGALSGPRLFVSDDVLARREVAFLRPPGSSLVAGSRVREVAAERSRPTLMPGEGIVMCAIRRVHRRWTGDAFLPRVVGTCPCDGCRDSGGCDRESFFRERFFG